MLAGLALRLFFIWRFPFTTPDSEMYEELARHWLDDRVYGLLVAGQLMPVDIRVPGYPAFLAAVYVLFGRSDLAVRLGQAVIDLATCGLTALLAARLAPAEDRARAATAALWLAALCPFTANYTAVPLTEVLTVFLATLAFLLFLDACDGARARVPAQGSSIRRAGPWFLAGVVTGLGTLVRPETPLVLIAVWLVLLLRWHRPKDWAKLARVGVLSAAGLFIALLPWAARNWQTLGRVQFVAPLYAELPSEFVPRGFYAWTKTWLVRMRDVYWTLWKLGEEPIRVDTLPASAFDNPQERERTALLLERYNAQLLLSPELDNEFARLAQERTARHPLRTYLWVPLARTGTLWFTPRTELLPYSGHLWPLAVKWREDPVDFLVTVGFGLLNFFYVGLAAAGAWRFRRQPAVQLLVAVILVRTVFLTQVETVEPRYTLACMPLILALAVLLSARRATV